MLTRDTTNDNEHSMKLWWAFNTPSMAVAFASSTTPRPSVMLSSSENVHWTTDKAPADNHIEATQGPGDACFNERHFPVRIAPRALKPDRCDTDASLP